VPGRDAGIADAAQAQRSRPEGGSPRRHLAQPPRPATPYDQTSCDRRSPSSTSTAYRSQSAGTNLPSQLPQLGVGEAASPAPRYSPDRAGHRGQPNERGRGVSDRPILARRLPVRPDLVMAGRDQRRAHDTSRIIRPRADPCHWRTLRPQRTLRPPLPSAHRDHVRSARGKVRMRAQHARAPGKGRATSRPNTESVKAASQIVVLADASAARKSVKCCSAIAKVRSRTEPLTRTGVVMLVGPVHRTRGHAPVSRSYASASAAVDRARAGARWSGTLGTLRSWPASTTTALVGCSSMVQSRRAI
jgi:hypothetical protein